MSGLQDFGYSLEDGLEHHLLWSTQPLSESRMTQVTPVTDLCTVGHTVLSLLFLVDWIFGSAAD